MLSPGTAARRTSMGNVRSDLFFHTEKLAEYMTGWLQDHDEMLSRLENDMFRSSGSTVTSLDGLSGEATANIEVFGGSEVYDEQPSYVSRPSRLSRAIDSDAAPGLMETVTEDSDYEDPGPVVREASGVSARSGPLGPKKIHAMSKSLQLSEALGPISRGLKASGSRLRVTTSRISEMFRASLAWFSCSLDHLSPSRACLYRLVHRRFFEVVSSLVIMGNAAFIAFSSDYAFQNLEARDTGEMKLVERMFCAAYAIEWLLRFGAVGMRYFTGKDRKWNAFDTFLVHLMVYDQISEFLQLDSANLSFLRIARLFKMLRVLRMIRLMRAFRELRLILAAIFACAKSLLWAVILLFIVTFMFGICFLQASTGFLAEKLSKNQLHAGSQMVVDIKRNWGSVFKAMHTLFAISTNGEDWLGVGNPLWQVSPWIYFIFLFYIAFFFFVVTNTLTSLFIEGTLQNSEKDLQVIIHEELTKKDEYISKLQKFFLEVDKNNTGHITHEDFITHMDSPAMLAFASNLDIDATDISLFFKLLSMSGKRSVDLETFVVGCMKMRGNARSMDLLDLIHQHRRTYIDLRSHHKFCQREFNKIRHSLHQQLRSLIHEPHSQDCLKIGEEPAEDIPQISSRSYEENIETSGHIGQQFRL